MFVDANEFSIFIETFVAKNKDVTYIDAILKYCEDNKVDPEDVASLVSKSLKGKLYNDYVDLRYFKKTATLDNILV